MTSDSADINIKQAAEAPIFQPEQGAASESALDSETVAGVAESPPAAAAVPQVLLENNYSKCQFWIGQDWMDLKSLQQ